jgi:hypothetical protein
MVKVLKETYIKGERDLVYRQKRPILIGIPALSVDAAYTRTQSRDRSIDR